MTPPLRDTSAHFQPERPLIRQLRAALASDSWEQFDVPVAYALAGGVRLLEDRLRSDSKWSTLAKRFLVGIDWCRSEPFALDALTALPHSSVRIVDGNGVVTVPGCVPARSYHPKGFIFKRQWPSSTGAIGCLVGSGNLSHNGLSHGRELDLWLSSDSGGDANRVAALADVADWFESLWSHATPYQQIRAAYRRVYEANQSTASRSNTDDDSVPSAIVRQRGLKPHELVTLRSFDNLWVDAGSMYSNLGGGRSGNQLELKRYTRVFFGFPARALPPNSQIGSVDITFGASLHADRHLRYGNNQMEKLDLPVPGQRAPADYRDETILFTRAVGAGGRVHYKLTVAGGGDRARWRAKSAGLSALFPFGSSSSREFGVF